MGLEGVHSLYQPWWEENGWICLPQQVNHWRSSTSSTRTPLDCSKSCFLFVLLCFLKSFLH